MEDITVCSLKGRKTKQPYRCVTFWLEQEKDLKWADIAPAVGVNAPRKPTTFYF
jgi:hypothetical protein